MFTVLFVRKIARFLDPPLTLGADVLNGWPLTWMQLHADMAHLLLWIAKSNADPRGEEERRGKWEMGLIQRSGG